MKTKSQKDRILKWMKSGRVITPIAALRYFGCFRLGARIYELKKEGHDITTKMVKRGGKMVASYGLIE